MMANTDAFTCSVCQKLYTNPVVHRPCGFSFDRQCITNRCPRRQCNQIINEHDLVINYDLLNTIDQDRFRLETRCNYYLILLDTSSSMWYSDTWLPFAIGQSRFANALQFIRGFFESYLNSMTDKISLVTFDTAQIQRFGFETITTTHVDVLKDLTCEGKDSALFDSIDFCLDEFKKLEEVFKNVILSTYLLILTDGGSNFGKKESILARKLAFRSGQLQITGHTIQIGDNNRKKTRSICDAIKYKFNHFNSGNIGDFVKSFVNSLKTETRARVSREQTQAARTQPRLSESQPSVDPLANTLERLPEVPLTPIKSSSSKQKTLA